MKLSSGELLEVTEKGLIKSRCTRDTVRQEGVESVLQVTTSGNVSHKLRRGPGHTSETLHEDLEGVGRKDPTGPHKTPHTLQTIPTLHSRNLK